jgi:hypothetical protein
MANRYGTTRYSKLSSDKKGERGENEKKVVILKLWNGFSGSFCALVSS